MLQFKWQDRVYRFRLSHAALCDKWFAVLKEGVRSLRSSALMHQGRIAILDDDGVSKEVWGSLTHAPKPGSSELQSTLWCYPTVAASCAGLSDVEGQPPGTSDTIWGQPAALRSRVVELDIPSPEELCKAFAIVPLNAEPPVPILTVDAPISVAMEGIREVQEGFDEAGRSYSINEPTEFQIAMQSGATRRFRTRTRKEQEDWMYTLRNELAAAKESRDDPVQILDTLLSPLMEEAPLVDEDVHFVLFTHDAQVAQSGDGSGASVEAVAGHPMPKGMPPIPKPSVPKPRGPKPGAESAESAEAADRYTCVGDQLIKMARQLQDEHKREVPGTEIELWLKSLGIKRWQHWGAVLNEKEMEMADVPFFTEETLVDIGISAMGPRIRMLNSIKFMTKTKSKKKDPTSGKFQLQVLLPNTNEIATVNLGLRKSVGDIKKELLFQTQVPERKDMRQKEVRRHAGPLKPQPVADLVAAEPGSEEDQRRTAAVAEHTLKLVSRMEPFAIHTVLTDDQLLREVPFIYFASQHKVVPRLMLQKNLTNNMKQALLLLVCGKLQKASEQYPTAVADFGDSQQLAEFLQIARAIEYIVDGLTVEGGHPGLIRRFQSFAAMNRVDAWKSAEATDVEQIAQAHARREAERASASFETHVHLSTDSAVEGIRGLVLREDWVPKPVIVGCTGETTVLEVMSEFRERFDRGTWAELFAQHEGMMTLKMQKYADIFERDERLYNYDVARTAIDEKVPLHVTVIFVPLIGAVHAAPPLDMPPLHPSLRLLVKEHEWLQPEKLLARSQLKEPEPEPEPARGPEALIPLLTKQQKSPKKQKKKGAKEESAVTYELGSKEHVAAMERVVSLDDDMQTVLWSMRDHPLMRASSRMLPKMIMAVPTWDSPEVVKQAYAMLSRWTTLGTAEAMQLLDPSFWELISTADKGFIGDKLDAKRLFRPFKDHAVECLATMGDGELEIYLLELCQLMKNEKLHNSTLARLLLYRGLRSPFTVGQSLFWHLRSEMHEGGGPTLFSLYGMFLRQYLERCGPHREELIKQEEHIQSLRKLVKTVKDTPAEQRLEVLQNECRQLVFPPGGMLLPTGSQHAMRVIGLVARKCKYMDSAQKPLWLEYISADPTGENIVVIFKDGDDVRQDILVLQMFRIMEQLWEAESLDVPLSVYGTASLGFEVGFVEVVTHSNTLSNITKDAAGASGVWDKTILHKWLKGHNPGKKKYRVAQDNFLRSCAGCCVATYVLGIADRHNDNVMIKEDGHLFHIDFGHFLGHVKRAAGGMINRDKAPFIFTDDFVYVLCGARTPVGLRVLVLLFQSVVTDQLDRTRGWTGKEGKKSPKWEEFNELCCTLYNVLRKHSDLFINLISIMVRCASIPALHCARTTRLQAGCVFQQCGCNVLTVVLRCMDDNAEDGWAGRARQRQGRGLFAWNIQARR